MEIDKKIIQRLIQTLEELKKSIKDKDILKTEIKYENQEILEETGTIIKSPIVGTAYLAPEPGAKKFVEVGKKIKKGDSTVIVEAMKTMNHIPSPSNGVVKKVCVEDGQPVEFGQQLIIIE